MFKTMHTASKPLVICNVWDVASALIAEQTGFLAIGTSSAAIARSHGLDDGENIEFEEILSVVKAIAQATDLPLNVDIESGYGDTPQAIYDNITELVNVGVVGINIEDSVVVNRERRLCDWMMFSQTLRKVKSMLDKANLEVFINVRIDTFLMDVKEPLVESIKRIQAYQQAGADGVFLPCIKGTDDIKAVVDSTLLPINVMCVPELPNFKELEALGVKRISMGNFLYEAMLSSLQKNLITIKREQSFRTLF